MAATAAAAAAAAANALAATVMTHQTSAPQPFVSLAAALLQSIPTAPRAHMGVLRQLAAAVDARVRALEAAEPTTTTHVAWEDPPRAAPAQQRAPEARCTDPWHVRPRTDREAVLRARAARRTAASGGGGAPRGGEVSPQRRVTQSHERLSDCPEDAVPYHRLALWHREWTAQQTSREQRLAAKHPETLGRAPRGEGVTTSAEDDDRRETARCRCDGKACLCGAYFANRSAAPVVMSNSRGPAKYRHALCGGSARWPAARAEGGAIADCRGAARATGLQPRPLEQRHQPPPIPR